MRERDEITIAEMYAFIVPQARTIIATLILTLLAGLAYTTTRPTLYKSTSSITIGNSLSLYTNSLTPLEKPEETSYKYSGISTVEPVKDTNIVEVSSIATGRDEAIKNVQATLKEIVDHQGKIYQDQEQKFVRYIKLLNISDASTAEILEVVQGAAQSSTTYQSEIVTTDLPYAGKLTVNLIMTFFASIALALGIGVVKELFTRARASG